MTVYEILRVLADGKFHSGEELGQALGVSRTAVWKHLQKLDDLGLEAESVKGRGYRIEGGVDLLDAEVIWKALPADIKPLLSVLDVFPDIGSTNHFLMSEKTGSGEVCLAERQSSGRGRRGRLWVSPFARNIYLSVSWSFNGGAQALEGLSLAIGVAVIKALEGLSVAGLSLKWPNDIYYHGVKLGGVLLEMSGDVSGDCRVVTGIGLNVNMPVIAAEAIDQGWVDIYAVAGRPIERNEIVVALLSKLLPLLAGYSDAGFNDYRQQWLSYDAFKGRSVRLLSADNVVRGVAAGVDESGALLLQTEQGLKSFSGGEVSLRAET